MLVEKVRLHDAMERLHVATGRERGNTMSTMQEPITDVEQCPLYRLLAAERQSLDATLTGFANGKTPEYDALNVRSRAGRMIQEGICRRRAYGQRLRASALSQIEQAVDHLPESEQNDILDALAACRAGCTLNR